MKPFRTIKFVALQTGLSVHVIRVWEKRYGAVRPRRAPNNRRLYTEGDMERLRLLHRATQAGHSISQIAGSPLHELRKLTREAPAGTRASFTDRRNKRSRLAREFVAAALDAVQRMDGDRLSELLDRAAVEVGSPSVLQDFIVPLVEQIGDCWRDGDFGIAHEHFATAIITGFLAHFARPFTTSESAPLIILTTPTGHLHELGAMIVVAAARSHGWRALYLGASLPVEELIRAARELKPKAIGLSIIFPPDDHQLRKDFARLRKLLPVSCTIIIGGRAAKNFALGFGKNGAVLVDSLAAFYPLLNRLGPKRSTAR